MNNVNLANNQEKLYYALTFLQQLRFLTSSLIKYKSIKEVTMAYKAEHSVLNPKDQNHL